jgi:uncharacterized membrane protein (UPF0127 family)
MRLARALAAAVVLCAHAASPAAAQRLPTVEVHPKGRAPVVVRVEVADTDETRSRGLMFRRELADDAGMLFVWPDAQVRSFWMRNTPLPLDMLFIGADGRLQGCVERAEPFTDTPRSIPRPARFVLEVNAGFCARHGLVAGDRLVVRGVPGAGQAAERP